MTSEAKAASDRLARAKYLEEIEFRDVQTVLAALASAEVDSQVVDFLSDPKNEFGYSIRANGQCSVYQPWPVLADNLRGGVLWVINWRKTKGQR